MRLSWPRISKIYLHFLLALALIAVVPLGIVGLGIATLDRYALSEQSARELTGIAAAVAGELNVKLDGLLRDTDIIAALPSVTSMDPKRQEQVLKELFLHNDQFSTLEILDGSGQLVASSHPNRQLPLNPEAFYRVTEQGHQTWLVITAPNLDQRVLLIYAPIRNPERQVVAVLAGAVNLRDLSTVVRKVQVGSGQAFVLDQAGRVLLHPNSETMNQAESGPWLDAFGAKELIGTGTTSYRVNDQPYNVGYAPLADFDWTVLVERPEAEVIAPAQRAYYLTLAALVITSGLAFLVALWLAGRLTRPIRNLVVAAQALTKGDSTVPLPTLSTKDSELRVLVTAFAEMREAVTERERALRHSEAQNRAILNAIPDLILQVNSDGHLLACTASPQNKFPLFSDNAVGKSIQQVCPEKFAAKALRMIHQTLLNPDQAQSLECQIPAPSGASNDYEARFVWSGSNEVLIMIRDITAQRQAEEQLRLMRSVVLNTSEAVVITEAEPIDKPGPRIVYVNEAFTRMTGYTADEITGLNPRILQGPGTDRAQLDKIREALANRQPVQVEVINYRKDGAEFWVDFSIAPLQDEHGHVTHLVSVQRDVTARKQAEQTLRLLASRLEGIHQIDQAILAAQSPQTIARSTLEHIQQLIGCERGSVSRFTDPALGQATVLAVNVNGQTTLGADRPVTFQRTELLQAMYRGEPYIMADLTKQPDLTRPEKMLQNEGIRSFLAIPLFIQEELSGILMLGKAQPHSFTADHIAIAGEAGASLAIALQQAELNEQIQRHAVELAQRVEERTVELSTANAELARAARLKDEFLAAMSHELRTPLNAILGMSESLQEQVFGSLNEDQLESVDEIRESGYHLLALINDILDLSKIEADQMELTVDTISLQSLCQASLRMIKQSAYHKQLKVISTIDQTVSAIQADERRLKQILVNLLSNAVKFTPSGGQIGLEVIADEDQEAIHFVVWDTGVGIAADDMERLFQPFVQLDSRLSRRYEGTGLGLALVYRLAKMHGGSISVESDVDQGSRFTVSLPWLQAETQINDPDIEPKATTELASPHLATRADQPLILLAEDNEANIRTMAGYLQRKGYQLIVARNGAEAIRLAQETQPHLILMDIQMPEMDGLEAIRQLRANPDLARRPIFALTALAMPGDRERCLTAGANVYMSKPVSLKQLSQAIEQQLEALTISDSNSKT